MYPVGLDIRGKLCVVVGGGRVARRKVHGLLAEGAMVRLISPEVTGELADLAAQGRLDWHCRRFAEGDLEGALLVFAATNDRHVQRQVCSLATEAGQLVNVADDPGCCNFHVPAVLRRGNLVVAVSTNGASPALAAVIRDRLAAEFGHEYEVLLALMAMIRQRQGGEDDSGDERKNIYKKILHDDIVEWIRCGQREILHAHLEQVLGPEFRHDIDKILSEME